MALAASLIGGIAAASYLAYRALRALKDAPIEVQADTVRTTRWVAGISMAACKFVYDVVGVYAGNRPQVGQPSVSANNGPPRFGMTAAQHEAAVA